jgi:hypothetical protein
VKGADRDPDVRESRPARGWWHAHGACWGESARN